MVFMPTFTSIGGRVPPKTLCYRTTCAIAVLSELAEHLTGSARLE